MPMPTRKKGKEGDEDGEEGENEEGEEEEEPPEMTPEEKQFQENLLMTAIRAGQGPMAEFLLDNGVNQNFSTSMMHMKETSGKNPTQRMEWYEYTCRQMAYDRDMFDIVEIIDALNGRLFPGVKPRQREPRLRRPPRSPEPSDATSEDSGDDFSSLTSAEDSDVSGEGQSSVDGEGGSRRMSGGDRRDVTRGSSVDASADTQGSGVKRTKRRMRATSGRSEGTLDGSEGEGGLSGSLRQRLQSEENMDRDSGHHSDDPGAAERDARSTERKKKKKSKGKDEEAEGEKTDAAKGPGSVGSGDAQGDQGDGSKGTARSSEQSADGATVVNDEGYETMSPSPSCIIRNQQTTQPQTVRFQQKVPQPNYMKMTRSSFGKRKLEPNFTNVYGSLDFVHPSAGRVDERGMLRKSPTVPKTVAGIKTLFAGIGWTDRQTDQ
nr:hypothetical protein BaRGS_029134 [Batillaria attramentaria]